MPSVAQSISPDALTPTTPRAPLLPRFPEGTQDGEASGPEPAAQPGGARARPLLPLGTAMSVW